MQQSNTFLQAVGTALALGQNATIDVTGMGEGQIKLIYTPRIGETPESASNEVAALRAAIAAPFMVVGTPADVEAAFAQRVAEKAQVVNRGLGALSEIERLAAAAVDASKAAQVKTAAKDQPAGTDDEEDDTELEMASANAAAPEPAAVPTTAGSIASSF